LALKNIYNNIKGLTQKINDLQYYTHFESFKEIHKRNQARHKTNEARNVLPCFLGTSIYNLTFVAFFLRVAIISLLAGYLLLFLT
jgi:hypothetical protein